MEEELNGGWRVKGPAPAGSMNINRGSFFGRLFDGRRVSYMSNFE